MIFMHGFYKTSFLTKTVSVLTSHTCEFMRLTTFLNMLFRMFSNSLFNAVLLSDNENLPPKGHRLLFMICIRHFHILGLGHSVIKP